VCAAVRDILTAAPAVIADAATPVRDGVWARGSSGFDEGVNGSRPSGYSTTSMRAAPAAATVSARSTHRSGQRTTLESLAAPLTLGAGDADTPRAGRRRASPTPVRRQGAQQKWPPSQRLLRQAMS